MLANPLSLFVLALTAAAGVSAQSADACTLACVQIGLANSTCSSLYVYILVLTFLYLTHAVHIRSTDLACVCNSTSFQQTAANCLAANCTAADQQAAIQLQKQECGSMYLSPSFFTIALAC
jgi:CFEM domain-containing protein